MNTKIILVVLALVVVGGVAFVLMGDTNDAENVTNTSDTSSVATQDEQTQEEVFEASGLGSLKDLMKRGESITCTFVSEATEDGGRSEGTFYLDDERFRVDGQMESNGTVANSHMLFDGEMTYVWTENTEETFAFKFAHDPNDTSFDGGESQFPVQEEQGAVSIEEQVSYECDRWRVDASVFVPPSNIEFLDMQAMFESSFGSFPVPQ